MSYRSRRHLAHVVSHPLPHLRVRHCRPSPLSPRLQPSSRYFCLRGTLLVRAPFAVHARFHPSFPRFSARAIACLFSCPFRSLVVASRLYYRGSPCSETCPCFVTPVTSLRSLSRSCNAVVSRYTHHIALHSPSRELYFVDRIVLAVIIFVPAPVLPPCRALSPRVPRVTAGHLRKVRKAVY